MTKRTIEILNMEIPTVYSNESKQSKYSTGYRNGRLFVDNGETTLPKFLKDLCEEYLRGYFDGIRDEILWQQEQEESQALQSEEEAP